MNTNLLRTLVYIAALCGLYLSTAMLVPAMVDLYYRDDNWSVFTVSAAMVGGISLTAAMATRGPPPAFSKRMGFLLVNVLWAVFSVVGAIPLYFADLDLTFAQALFESISGITTTGSTVISGLDNIAPGILMWRSLLAWLGGIGIVALGLFVLPFLRVGGMSFFKMESSDTGDKPFARLATFTRAFMAVYVGITLACIIAYDFAGMSHFDAINHAFSTVATAGFSTHDMSFAYFDSYSILWISTFFMTVCSLPFSILIVFVIGITSWMHTARIVRGDVLAVKSQEFILAAKSSGMREYRVILKHILPNVMSSIMVSATLGIASAIITESALSFLGLGFPSDFPTWGRLLFDGANFLQINPSRVLWPGLAISLTVLSVNYIGDAIRDALDPRALKH